jgi:hypothetical protein
LFVAGLVALHVILLIRRVTKYHAARLKLVRLAGSLGILLLVQLLLGVGSYFAKFITLLQLPIDMVVFLTTTHLIVGALMLVTSLALTIHSFIGETKPAGGKMRLTASYLVRTGAVEVALSVDPIGETIFIGILLDRH